ncbi:MAG: hypothetical protein ABI399_02865 [Bauldia sp.]
MNLIVTHADLIGGALRTRLDHSAGAPSISISNLVARLQAVFKKHLPRETGQEIGDRAGLFDVGDSVKRRIGVPGLTFSQD